MPLSSVRTWFKVPPTDSARGLARGLDIVRMVVAIILLLHPLHGLIHPADIRGFGQFLASRGFPMGVGLAWAVILLQVGCSVALLARRLIIPACLGHFIVLSMGIWLVHAPNWYVVGGAAIDGHPGAEFSVLLMACLLGVGWVQGLGHSKDSGIAQEQPSARQGLDLIRIAAALLLMAHPVHGFFDPEGLRAFGHGLESLGFPCGYQLVWATLLLQTASSLALITRRFVVPACLGQIFVLSMGIWIAHAPRWFVVGPGENGMEYSVLLIACFVSVLLAHWPKGGENGGRETL